MDESERRIVEWLDRLHAKAGYRHNFYGEIAAKIERGEHREQNDG